MILDTFAILHLVHMNVVVNFLASQPELRLDFVDDLRLDEVHTTFSLSMARVFRHASRRVASRIVFQFRFHTSN